MLNMWMINDDVDQHHIYSFYRNKWWLFSFSRFLENEQMEGKEKREREERRNKAKSKEAEESKKYIK